MEAVPLREAKPLMNGFALTSQWLEVHCATRRVQLLLHESTSEGSDALGYKGLKWPPSSKLVTGARGRT